MGKTPDYDLNSALSTPLKNSVVVASTAKELSPSLRRAQTLALVAEQLVQTASRHDPLHFVSDEYLKRMRELRDDAYFALEHDDTLVAQVRAKGVMSTFIQGRQEMLRHGRVILPDGFQGVPLEKSNGSVSFRIYTASKLLQLLQFGAQQQVEIIKLAVIGERELLQREFGEMLGAPVDLASEDEEDPGALFLRASVSRQMLIYTIAFPLESISLWLARRYLSGFSAAVFYARDASNVCEGDGRHLLACMTQVPKDNLVVSLLGDTQVDELFKQNLRVVTPEQGAVGLPELLRRAIYRN